MKATLISYMPGMSGDFISFLVHQDPKFYPISQESDYYTIRLTRHNMWRFPNLLEPIGLEAKIYPYKQWRVTAESLKVLNDVYGDRQILLPSHWYSDISPKLTGGLFNQGIRLFVKDPRVLKICYALWWIKSHTIANDIWPHRREEIQAMIDGDHPLKNLLESMLASYHNWKFLSIKYNLLDNGQFNIHSYIRRYFREVYAPKNHANIQENYLTLCLDNVIYGDMSELKRLEQYLEVTVDRTSVEQYTDTNYKLLENYLGFSVNSSKFDSDDTYFNAIIDYAHDIIEQRPNQFDYYNGKCN